MAVPCPQVHGIGCDIPTRRDCSGKCSQVWKSTGQVNRVRLGPDGGLQVHQATVFEPGPRANRMALRSSGCLIDVRVAVGGGRLKQRRQEAQ